MHRSSPGVSEHLPTSRSISDTCKVPSVVSPNIVTGSGDEAWASLVAILLLTTPQHPGVKDEETEATRCSGAPERRAYEWWHRAPLLSPSPLHLCTVTRSPRALFTATLLTKQVHIPSRTHLPLVQNCQSLGTRRLCATSRMQPGALSCQHRVI